MERLTKRDKSGKAIPAKTSTATYVGTIYEENKILEKERLDRLSELEDKLESGQLVELPHKVGDKVYLVRRNRNYELVVSRTKIEMYLYHWKLLVKCSCDSSWHEPQDCFSNKEQAEARLKELQEKGQ